MDFDRLIAGFTLLFSINKNNVIAIYHLNYASLTPSPPPPKKKSLNHVAYADL